MVVCGVDCMRGMRKIGKDERVMGGVRMWVRNASYILDHVSIIEVLITNSTYRDSIRKRTL
jgi:hypothetical protein